MRGRRRGGRRWPRRRGGGRRLRWAAPISRCPVLPPANTRRVVACHCRPAGEASLRDGTSSGRQNCRLEMVMGAWLETAPPGPWWARRSSAASHDGNTQLTGEHRCGVSSTLVEAPPQPHASCDKLHGECSEVRGRFRQAQRHAPLVPERGGSSGQLRICVCVELERELLPAALRYQETLVPGTQGSVAGVNSLLC